MDCCHAGDSASCRFLKRLRQSCRKRGRTKRRERSRKRQRGKRRKFPGGANEGSSGQGKGRYVEIQESLPQELADWSILQMYQVDEKLRFLAVKAEGGKAILREWEKQGESYADVTGKWLSSMEIACMADWLDARLAQGGDGTQYLYAGYIAEGEDDFKPHLWKSDGDQAVEITPQKWTVPDEELGSYEW